MSGVCLEAKNAVASPFESCNLSDFLTLVQGIPAHSIQLIAGIDSRVVRTLIDSTADNDGTSARPILFMDSQGLNGTETIIDRAVEQLAAVAADVWPFWFEGEDFSEINDAALMQLYLQIKLTALLSRYPGLSVGWAEAAIRQILRGRAPRVPSAPQETEWSQLCHAISPTGLVIVISLEETPSQRAWALVHALEWLAAKGNVAIVILCQNPPPREAPFDHLLFGARVVLESNQGVRDSEPARTSVSANTGYDPKPPAVELVLPPVSGRPHPQSPIEQRLAKMINADIELASKFVFNARVDRVSLKSPKVDLLWAAGRVVIEFDGPEHLARRAYREDRHRDYELLCAGYLVLRIPNDEIIEDFTKAIEKIRSVVKLRNSTKEA